MVKYPSQEKWELSELEENYLRPQIRVNVSKIPHSMLYLNDFPDFSLTPIFSKFPDFSRFFRFSRGSFPRSRRSSPPCMCILGPHMLRRLNGSTFSPACFLLLGMLLPSPACRLVAARFPHRRQHHTGVTA